MIRLLQGKVHSKEARSIILMTGGVGCQVFVSSQILDENDEELTLFIHTHVREDQITLYGFRTQSDMQFYELLLSINGVGPKMALAFANEPAELIQKAILEDDIAFLTRIPGVGKKIAQRLILELKNKVTGLEASVSKLQSTNSNEEATAALETLGYKRKHIQNVFSSMDREITETEEIIRVFLKSV